MNRRGSRELPLAGRPRSSVVPASPPNLPRLLDVNAVAELLSVAPRHIRRLVAERRIPYLKWGRYLRFDPQELEQWLNQARRAPSNGVEFTSQGMRLLRRTGR